MSLFILTVSFSYAEAANPSEIFLVLPTILATSVLVGFVKNYALLVCVRVRKIWAEHRLWYYGLGMFLFTTLVFKSPFSSPSQNVNYKPQFTKRLEGLVSLGSVLITLAFAAVFYLLFLAGFNLIGSVGLVMCLMGAFFDSLPLPSMNGRSIYDWDRKVWLILFIATLSLYAVWVLLE